MQSHKVSNPKVPISHKKLSVFRHNGAPATSVNSVVYSLRCEDLAEIIWINRQQIRQLEMIHEGLNIPNQETSMNILPELSDGLNVLLDQLVKSSFVIEKQPPQVIDGVTIGKINFANLWFLQFLENWTVQWLMENNIYNI